MKSKLYKSAVLLLLAALVGSVALFGWPQYLKHAENSALESVARHSHEITAVEVLHLSDTGETGPAGSYLVRYDDARRGITTRQSLVGPQASELVRVWGGVRLVEGYMAMCHDPGFVLRFLVGRRCVFEVAVCFDCENVSWQAAPFTASCRQMATTAFDKKSGMDALKTFLTQLR